MNTYFVLCPFVFLNLLSVEGDEFLKRSKRTLIYIPPGGVFQLVMGVGLPLVLNDESIIVGIVLKSGYSLPDNSTDFTRPNVILAKKKRSVSRWDLYDVMVKAAEIYRLGGKECVLRTICEVAEIPFDYNRGLLDQLVHTVFTPSSTEDEIRIHSDNIYQAAEQLGRNNKKSCHIFFPECKISFATIFTRLRPTLV